MHAVNAVPDALSRFQSLFTSYTKAHGRFCITGTAPESGKKKGIARTVYGRVSDAEWHEHFSVGGREGLGLIPLSDDGVSVQWAAIDIDDNAINHLELERLVSELGLPLVVCRSKSGGAHCYLFLETPCPVKEVVDALKNWSGALGYPGVETFPKQTSREVDSETGKPRPGNWINLPYFGAGTTDRYCVSGGESLSLDGFVELAEGSRVGQEALKIRHIIATHSEITRSAKSQEGRNGFLFSAGCRLRYRGADDDEVRSNLAELNQLATPQDHPNFVNGPLQERELEQVLSSVLKLTPGGTPGIEEDIIAELNGKHAVVMVGGKCVIANQQMNPVFGFEDLTFSSPTDFITRYSNRHVGEGKRKIPIGKAWLAHPARRQYNGVIFVPGEEVPGYLNLDTGFAVEPKNGDCSRFLEHTRNNICKGDENISDYLFAWMADGVQNRSKRPGIAVVLRGKMGTGKGVFCTQYGALFGPHFIPLAHGRHLTGNFNSHLKDKLVVYSDEAFWAGDKNGEAVLKAMITEDTIQIEMKGKDVLTFRNYIRLLISSNKDWVVPAGNEERRFIVIDVGEVRLQDRAYFGSIVDQMNNGGREALLHYLLEYDLSDVALGSPPRTEALQEQKTHSASPVQNWWLERLMDGHTTSDGTQWKPDIRTDTLYEDYCDVSQKIGIKRRVSAMAFGKELKTLIPGLERVRTQKQKNRYWAYQIPSLEACRRHFDLITRSDHDWPADD